MKKYSITAEVKFVIHYLNPPETEEQRILRQRDQLHLDVKAHAISEALSELLEATTISGDKS